MTRSRASDLRAEDRSVRQGRARDGELEGELGAVRPAAGDLDAPADQPFFAGGEMPRKPGVVGIPQRGWNDRVHEPPADRLVPAEPERPFRGRVEFDEPPRPVDRHHGIEGGIDHRRLAQRFLLERHVVAMTCRHRTERALQQASREAAPGKPAGRLLVLTVRLVAIGEEHDHRR